MFCSSKLSLWSDLIRDVCELATFSVEVGVQLVHVLHVDGAPLLYNVCFNHDLLPWELLPKLWLLVSLAKLKY